MPTSRFLTITIAIAVALAVSILWLYFAESSLGSSARVILGAVGLLMLIVAAATASRAALLGMIAAAMILTPIAYAYRYELQEVGQRVFGALTPSHAEATGKGSVSFAAWPDGQFRIEALVDGKPMVFLVDTGASDVVLTPQDAARLGYDPSKLRFTDEYLSANGKVMGAPIVLREISIGPVRLPDVRATVDSQLTTNSLLGVSFLNRLRSYRVDEGTLTLEQ